MSFNSFEEDRENAVQTLLLDFNPDETWNTPSNLFRENTPAVPPNTVTMQKSSPPSTPARSVDRFSIIPTSAEPSSGNRYADRHIPSRQMSRLEDALQISGNDSAGPFVLNNQSQLNQMLRSELLGETVSSRGMPLQHTEANSSSNNLLNESDSNISTSQIPGFLSPPRRTSSSLSQTPNLFKFRSPPGATSSSRTSSAPGAASVSPFPSTDTGNERTLSLSAARERSQGRARFRTASMGGEETRAHTRKIAKVPYKVLDAPGLQDDYYLNLLDWSSQNVVSVALGNRVYLWSATSGKSSKLCEFEGQDAVTSVSWSKTGEFLAVGLTTGAVEIWDTHAAQRVRELRAHDARVGALAWSSTSSLLASGSRDRAIALHDPRVHTHTHTRHTPLSLNSPFRTAVPRRRSSGGRTPSNVANLQESMPSALESNGSTAAVERESERDFSPSLSLSRALSASVALSSPPRSLSLSREEAIASVFELPLNTAIQEVSESVIESVHTHTPPHTPTRAVSHPHTPLTPHTRSAQRRAAGTASSAASDALVGTLRAHTQEVCGLRFAFDDKSLASGGNDNRLCVWDLTSSTHNASFSTPTHTPSSHTPQTSYNGLSPRCVFTDHTAAVKAVAWSPHTHGLLASGGGTADRHIRFWNTHTGSALHNIDTGSQVCAIQWSRSVNELISTHGYSLNQCFVWKYPSMQKIATLSGHTTRVLYLALSPDGQTAVTGAGDETLRFWHVFPPEKHSNAAHIASSVLRPSPADAR